MFVFHFTDCIFSENSTFEMPSEIMKVFNNDTGNTHLNWSHPNPDLVDHYYLLVESDSDLDFPAINISSTEILIPSLNFSGTLSAFDYCGRKSEPVSFGKDNFITSYSYFFKPLLAHYTVPIIITS